MKIQLLAGLYLASVTLTACQAEPTTEYYLTPIVTGQILDSHNNQPIINANVLYTSNTYTTTDKEGYFRLPAITSDGHNADSGELSEMDIVINKENYKGKTYSNFGISRIKVVSAPGVPEYIHMGIVYLTPLPSNVKIEDSYKYEEYIEDIPYCQVNQPQKEVDCIPIPEGMTYDQVSSI